MILQCRGLDDPTPAGRAAARARDLLDRPRVTQRTQVRATTPRRRGATTCTPTEADNAPRSPGWPRSRPECARRRRRFSTHLTPFVARQRHGLRGLHRRDDAARGRRRRGLPARRDRRLHRHRRQRLRCKFEVRSRRRERVARLHRQGRLLDRGHPDRGHQLRPRRPDPTTCMPQGRPVRSPARATSPTQGVDQAVVARPCGGRRPTGATGSRSRSPSGCRPTPATSSTPRPPTGFYGSELMAQAVAAVVAGVLPGQEALQVPAQPDVRRGRLQPDGERRRRGRVRLLRARAPRATTRSATRRPR